MPSHDGDGPDPAHGDLVDRVLAAGPPSTVYQPVVDLTDPATPVVGFEALARWPALGEVSVATLFDLVRDTPRAAELDWLCRAAAVRGALDAGLADGTALFVNAEPETASTRPPEPYLELGRQATARWRMVVEVTERHIMADASALLASITRAREAGWWVALDDVGVNPDSLAMLEFIRPDMVKLDLGFVQRELDPDAARTLRGVAAYCERTGAQLIAEGIETAEHLERAVGIGATLGQGYHFGRPGPLHTSTTPIAARRVRQITTAETPYAVIAERRGYRIASKSVLKRLADDVEAQLATLPDPPVVLAAIRRGSDAGPEAIRRYTGFGPLCSLLVLLGADMARVPGPGVHGAALAPGDPLRDEWATVVVGIHGAVAIAAQDLGDTGVPDAERRFRYTMTQDRDLVIAAGVSLLNRLVRAVAGEASVTL